MEKNMQYYVKISNEVMLKNVHRRKALTKDLVEKYLSSGKYNICIVASGSSLNAALTAEMFMNKYLGAKVTIISPTEYMYYRKALVKDDFIIVISQSGCSTNIIEAVLDMKQDGIVPMALTGDMEGSLKRHVDTLIEYGVGNETVEYVTLGMITLVEYLILFALEVSLYRKVISEGEYKKIVEDMILCCGANKEAYDKSVVFTQKYYKELFQMDRAIVVADGANMGIAREASLKFGETLKIPVLYCESEEYAHGPNMQLTPEYSVFFIDTNPKTDRMYDVFKATGKVIRHAYLVTNKPVQDGENILQFDVDVLPELTPLFTVVLFQYISATVTIEKNNFKCHPFFEKFEKTIKIKTDEYEEIYKAKQEQ